MYGQVETLQRYFDACAELNQKNGGTLDLGDGLKPIDFKVTEENLFALSICLWMVFDRVNQSHFEQQPLVFWPHYNIALILLTKEMKVGRRKSTKKLNDDGRQRIYISKSNRMWMLSKWPISVRSRICSFVKVLVQWATLTSEALDLFSLHLVLQ